MKIPRRYRNTLTGYLNWITDDFLRPKFELDEAGPSAALAMFQWESHGIALPSASCEPDLLAKYVQGKKSRDFYVKNWRDDAKEQFSLPEESLFCLGMDEAEFRSVFGRPPCRITLFELGMLDEMRRMTGPPTTPVERFLQAVLVRLDEMANDEKMKESG